MQELQIGFIFGTLKLGDIFHLSMRVHLLLKDGMNHPSSSFARQNQFIIYPDESVIVANRTTNDFTLEIEGDFASETNRSILPEAGNQLVCNNPYGLDLLLAELIPSQVSVPHLLNLDPVLQQVIPPEIRLLLLYPIYGNHIFINLA